MSHRETLLALLPTELCIKTRALLQQLQAPDDMSRLLIILENLLCALQATPDGLARELLLSASYPYDVVHGLNSALQSQNDLPFSWTDESARQHGLIDQHPEWAMLIMPRNHRFFSSHTYRQHQVIILLCCALQRQRHDKLGSEISAACRDLRKLASSKLPFSLLFPVTAEMTLKQYHHELEEVNNSGITGLTGMELLVRKVLLLQGKSRERKTGAGSGNSSQHQNNDLRPALHIATRRDPDDEEAQGPEHTHISQEDGFDSSARTLGLHPEECTGITGVANTMNEDAPTAGFAGGDHIRRFRHSADHVARNNQRLPFRHSKLLYLELAYAMYQAIRISRDRTERHAPLTSQHYAACMMMLLIFLGRSVDALFSMRIYRDFAALPRQRTGLLAYLEEEKCFAIDIPSPKWKTSLSTESRRLLHEIGGAPPMKDSLILLPVVCKELRLFLDLSTGARRHGKAGYSLLFPIQQQDRILEALRAMLSKINKKKEARLTLKRLNHPLFDEIAKVSSDWADAYLLTGQHHASTQAACHYYFTSTQQLLNRYRMAAYKLMKGILRHFNEEDHLFTPQLSLQQPTMPVGSQLTFDDSLLKLTVDHIQSELRQARQQRPSNESLRNIHNRLVRHTIFWLIFLTGYRPVSDYLFQLSEVDWETGALLISDKDGETSDSVRLIWLTEKLRRQLQVYMRHLHLLARRLPERKSLTLYINDVLHSPRPSRPLFFFISEHWRCTRVTPASLSERFSEFSLPLNVNRHFLRSKLRASGCPGELVNAFLGHWQLGQSPYDRYSVQSPMAMMAKISPYLVSIEKRAGWRIERGCDDA